MTLTEKINKLTRTFSYYSDKSNVLLFGRQKKETTTFSNKIETTSENYSLTRDGGLEISTTRTTHDGLISSNKEVFDIVSGLSRTIQDATSGSLNISYDAQGNVLKESYKLNGQEVINTTFTYVVGNGENNVSETGTAGRTTLYRYNNAGNLIAVYIQQKNGETTLQSENFYNANDELLETKTYDWIEFKRSVLSTKYDYDVWGDVCKIIHSDGKTEYTIKDQVEMTVTSYTEGMNKTVEHFDIKGNVVKKEVFDSNDTPLHKLYYSYDALSRLTASTTSLGAQISYSYDDYDRLIKKSISADSKSVAETYRYADHSPEELLASIEVDGASIATKKYDGLGRVVEETKNGGMYQYRYSDSSNEPSAATLPNGLIYSLSYHPVSRKVTAISVEGHPAETRCFEYYADGSLKKEMNTHATRELTYDEFGRIGEESVEVANQDNTAIYTHSFLGLMLSSKGYFGETKNIEYDEKLRPSIITLADGRNHIELKIGYDRLGRQVSQTAGNEHQKLELNISYNAQGMESSREWSQNGNILLSQHYEYDKTLRLSKRTTNETSGTLVETVNYDQLGRISNYSNTPSYSVPTEHVVSQSYRYDALGNISHVYSTLKNGRNETESFTYSLSNPLQLDKIISTKPDVMDIYLSYDDLGNQQVDTRGNRYAYDVFSQIKEITTKSGNTVKSFGYCAAGKQMLLESGQDKTLLHYQHGSLSNASSAQYHTSFLGLQGQPLSGEVSSQTNKKPTMMISNLNGDTLGMVGGQETRNRYSPFGEKYPTDPINCKA